MSDGGNGKFESSVGGELLDREDKQIPSHLAGQEFFQAKGDSLVILLDR